MKRGSLIDDVIAKKATLKQAAKVRKVRKPQLPFEDRVWLRWNRFVCYFSPTERRQVMDLVHGWTTKESK